MVGEKVKARWEIAGNVLGRADRVTQDVSRHRDLGKMFPRAGLGLMRSLSICRPLSESVDPHDKPHHHHRFNH